MSLIWQFPENEVCNAVLFTEYVHVHGRIAHGGPNWSVHGRQIWFVVSSASSQLVCITQNVSGMVQCNCYVLSNGNPSRCNAYHSTS